LTRKLTPLSHPRRHKWEYHFRIDGPLIVGATAISRATVQVLAMNHNEAVRLRESLIQELGG
jgi:hypothetical protein